MHGAPARRKTGRKGGRSKVRTRQKTPPSTHPCEASGTREAAARPAVHNSGVNALAESILEYLAERDRNPKRYVWRAKGVAILEKIERVRMALNPVITT
jgi:hypothetical protein